MKPINRRDIHLLVRNSNLSQQAIERALQEQVHQPKKAWDDFFRISLLTLGIGFFCIGVIFFFAYNWQDLNKFAKLGIIQVLLLAAIACYVFLKSNPLTKNLILCGASLLIGVLFAVFGQIYQTGANAYDFFLAWTLFVAIWALVSRFPPLWIIFIALINCTFILYMLQVVNPNSWIVPFMMLSIGNALFCASGIIWNLVKQRNPVPEYFIQITGLASIVFMTLSMVLTIYSRLELSQFAEGIAFIYLYSIGIIYGLKYRKLFFLTSIPFSLIILISAWLLTTEESEGMIFTVGLFIIISVSLLVAFLIAFQRKHRHEN